MMNEVNDIVKELQELQSPLATMPRTMPYAVPQGYFAQLEESIIAGISASDDIALPLPDKQMPYHTPEGYFESFAENTLKNVQKTVSKEPAYIVPEGYFDQLPAQMLEKAKQEWARPEPRRKVIPLWKNLAWAAAAILVLGIGFDIYRSANKAETVTTEEQLAQLSNGTINEYIQSNIDEFDTEIIVADMNTATTATPSPQQLQEDEIIEYLNETGWNETVNNDI